MGFVIGEGLHEGDGWVRFSRFKFGKILKLVHREKVSYEPLFKNIIFRVLICMH